MKKMHMEKEMSCKSAKMPKGMKEKPMKKKGKK